jgi:hypothetical protein
VIALSIQFLDQVLPAFFCLHGPGEQHQTSNHMLGPVLLKLFSPAHTFAAKALLFYSTFFRCCRPFFLKELLGPCFIVHLSLARNTRTCQKTLDDRACGRRLYSITHLLANTVLPAMADRPL